MSNWSRHLVSCLLISVCLSRVSSLTIDWDSSHDDNKETQQALIDEFFKDVEVIKGNRIRDIVFRYHTGYDLKTVEEENKRLYSEGVVEPEDFKTFSTILVLDFLLEKVDMREGANRTTILELISRGKFGMIMKLYAEEFKERLMSEALELHQQGKLKIPEEAFAEDQEENGKGAGIEDEKQSEKDQDVATQTEDEPQTPREAQQSEDGGDL